MTGEQSTKTFTSPFERIKSKNSGMNKFTEMWPICPFKTSNSSSGGLIYSLPYQNENSASIQAQLNYWKFLAVGEVHMNFTISNWKVAHSFAPMSLCLKVAYRFKVSSSMCPEILLISMSSQAGIDEIPTHSTVPQIVDLEVFNLGILADDFKAISERAAV